MRLRSRRSINLRSAKLDRLRPPHQAPRHFFAYVRQAFEHRPSVTAVVMFGLASEDDSEQAVYLEIRFLDYDLLQIEGDHLFLSLQEAMSEALANYGIEQTDWREMSPEEIDRIP